MFVDSVGEEFRQGTVQMTRLCSVLSEPQLERPAGWDDSATGRLNNLGATSLSVALGSDWLEPSAQLGQLARVLAYRLLVWLGLPHSMVN